MTPEQMRALADEWDTEQQTFGPDLEAKTAAALRAAADTAPQEGTP